MNRLEQITRIIQLLMKVLPLRLLPQVIALARAVMPLPSKQEDLPGWESRLSIGGPLAAFVTEVWSVWLESSMPSPSPTPAPTPAPAPTPSPAPHPQPAPDPVLAPLPSDDDLWEAITDTEGELAEVVCGIGAAAMIQWLELAKILWQYGEPLLAQLLTWLRAGAVSAEQLASSRLADVRCVAGPRLDPKTPSDAR